MDNRTMSVTFGKTSGVHHLCQNARDVLKYHHASARTMKGVAKAEHSQARCQLAWNPNLRIVLN